MLLKKHTQSVILGKLPLNFHPVKMSGKEESCVLPCLLLVWIWQFKWGTIQNCSSVRKKQTNETDDKSFLSGLKPNWLSCWNGSRSQFPGAFTKSFVRIIFSRLLWRGLRIAFQSADTTKLACTQQAVAGTTTSHLTAHPMEAWLRHRDGGISCGLCPSNIHHNLKQQQVSTQLIKIKWNVLWEVLASSFRKTEDRQNLQRRGGWVSQGTCETKWGGKESFQTKGGACPGKGVWGLIYTGLECVDEKCF